MFTILSVLVFDTTFNQIIKSQKIPGIVRFWFELALGSCLKRGLSKVYTIILIGLQCATLTFLLWRLVGLSHARCAMLGSPLATDIGIVSVDVHRSMGDGREHAISAMLQVDGVVPTELHALHTFLLGGTEWVRDREILGVR